MAMESGINQKYKSKTNLILCGFKAHASIVFSTLIKLEHINIIAVFADENESFCLENKSSISGPVPRAFTFFALRWGEIPIFHVPYVNHCTIPLYLVYYYITL